MTTVRLLAVVEVLVEDRVVCQAPGCKHPVYKRIHVVSENETLKVLGSECFKKLFGASNETPSVPHYGSSEGRQLTKEERQLLIENTERLIAQFEAEHQAELQRVARLQPAGPPRQSLPPPPPKSPPPPSREAIRAAEQQAKEDVRAKYGIDPDLPGWRGLVEMRVCELLR